MVRVRKCSKCGNMISEGGSFCPFCGNIINDKVIIQGKTPDPYGEQDEIQRKYRNDINSKVQKKKELENKKESLLKRKESLELKIDNYSKIMQKKIPYCERNKTAPDIPVIKVETAKVDIKWYIAAVIAVLEIISGIMPWATIYYGDIIQGETISCAKVFDLLNNMSRYSEWSDHVSEVFGPLVFISLLGFIMIFFNGFFIARILQGKSAEEIGTIAGISGIVVSVAVFLEKWSLNSSMEEEEWSWMSVNTEAGVWLMLFAGIALIAVIVFYKNETETQTGSGANFNLEVLNYDPALPLRLKTLGITRENDELVLKLTYAEFEWTYIEEIIADVQLVKADGSIKTLARNAVFEKKGQNYARVQFKDIGYDLEGAVSARVNILAYDIYKNQKKYQEKGSGFSAYSDYSADELRSARFANTDVVMCREKNIGEYHQCCCGQVYSNKISICPLCGKTRKG